MKVYVMEHSEDDFTNYLTSEIKRGSKTVCADDMSKGRCCLGPGYGQAAPAAESRRCSPS